MVYKHATDLKPAASTAFTGLDFDCMDGSPLDKWADRVSCFLQTQMTMLVDLIPQWRAQVGLALSIACLVTWSQQQQLLSKHQTTIALTIGTITPCPAGPPPDLVAAFLQSHRSNAAAHLVSLGLSAAPSI